MQTKTTTLHFWTEAELTADFWFSCYLLSTLGRRRWPDWPFRYNLDTGQSWVQEDESSRKIGISYYGMYVTTAIGFEPYRVMLGGIEMGGYQSLWEALTASTTVLRNDIMLATLHMENYGQPCSEICDACDGLI